MTTWTGVTQQSTSYEFPATLPDGYVLIDYMQDGYLQPEGIWTTVAGVSTTWTPS